MIKPYLIQGEAPTGKRKDALDIFAEAVNRANPYENTVRALRENPVGKVRFLLAIGKAASPMTDAAFDVLGAEKIKEAVVVTKYGHSAALRTKQAKIFEAGHPKSDENSISAAEYVLNQTKNLKADDICLVLLSGGGSALFETSLVSPDLQREVSERLLNGGADIYELNAVRKRMSAVKGGKLARHFLPAKTVTLALSDVPGSRPDVIASGPTVDDIVTNEQFLAVVQKYHLPEEIRSLTGENQPLPSMPYTVVGDVSLLCEAAKEKAESLGYEVITMQTDLTGDAEEQTERILRDVLSHTGKQKAFIYGGETTVCVHGTGKGGRSQQAALQAAIFLKGNPDCVFLAGASDGTDGPTDAAGGLVDGQTAEKCTDAEACLRNNDAYNGLRTAGALLMTGPTGTNVNDIFIILK